MLNQKLRNIRSFFIPGKKSIFSSAEADNTSKQTGDHTDRQHVRLLYYRDLENTQTIETKPETMQHDWWIN